MTEWNMRSTTQPINITSSHDGYNEDKREYSTTLNDNNDLDVKFNNLTVGSLPSIRRERRLIVSSGNHEFISNSGVTGNRSPSIHGRRRHSGIGTSGLAASSARTSSRRKQKSDSSIIHQMSIVNSIASSMPVPSAPFLASRNDQASDDRLSRIPNMALPESASESFSLKSVPYGSLNESQFRFPASTSYQNANGNMHARSYNPNQGSTYNLQQRVEKMRKNRTLIKNQTKSGIAALLGDNNNENEEVKNPANEQLTDPKKSLGIGALLNEFGQDENTGAATNSLTQNPYSSRIPSSINIGSNNTNTSTLSMPNQSQNTTAPYYLDSNSSSNDQIATPTVMIPNNNNQNQQNYNNHEDINGQTSNFESSPSTQISGSLTGLDILKQTPRGMAKLNAQETKAILDIQARSRSYSDEVKNFLNGRMDSTNNRSPLNIGRQDFYGVNNEEEDMGVSYQYSIGNSSSQRRPSNSSDTSLNHGDLIGHDPDFDGAFDLDMDC